jgi:type I restriction enzyme S subunit
MEMKPGYKQTEVGVIPDDWEIHKSSDLCERIMVGIVIRPSQYYTRDGVPALRSANIREDGINDIDLVFISEESNQLLAKSQVREGDVLTVRTGYPGTSAVAEAKHSGSNCIDILITRPSSRILPQWLCLWINSPFGKEQVLRNQGGLAQKHFNVSDMRNLVVALPQPKEQREISRAMCDVDVLINSLEELIEKKRNIKQAAMQELLTGKRRLPGFEGEWEVKRLGEICEIGIGRTPSRLDERMWGQGHPWLSIADLQRKVVSESKEQVTETAAALMTIVSKGTLLMSFKLSIGRLCFAGCDLFTNEAICSFNRLTANADYLYYALGRTDFSLYGKQAVKGYTLNKESLNLVEVKLPSQDEQIAIATVLSDMDTELAALKASRGKARALKQAMMQELLTGRIRLR